MLERNPRYFTDGSGKAVYLTGSHVWWNLLGGRTWKVDCRTGSAGRFDYAAHLDRLAGYGHNFIRMWTAELTRWDQCDDVVTVSPLPWLRTGPGKAWDGRPKFDLRRFDPAYFGRLRARVRAAGARGIYVSVMLFEGWGLQFLGDWRWKGHPFNARNNVNGIDGDANGDGTGLEVHSLTVPAVTAIQRAYVRKVVDTVGDLDNVLLEIANESGAPSIPWQYHMVDVVKGYEAKKRVRHPVGMTFAHPHGTNASLLRSRADWVSPFGLAYMTDPPAADGRKVSLSDTDHHCGLCGDATFPWRSFLRGHNPIYMDPFDDDPLQHAIRSAMGQTRRYTKRIDLAAARPRGDLASTRYCLAVPGREYLVYQPEQGAFTVDLRGASGRFTVEWFAPATDTTSSGVSVAGGRTLTFVPPFAGQAVLYIRRAGSGGSP